MIKYTDDKKLYNVRKRARGGAKNIEMLYRI